MRGRILPAARLSLLAAAGRLGGLICVTQKLNYSRSDRKVTLSSVVDSRTILTKSIDCKEIKKKVQGYFSQGLKS